MGEEIELTDQEFEEACKEAGLEKSLKSYLQKEGDRRVDKGIKSYAKNQEKKDLSDKERIESLETELKEMKNNKSEEDIKTLVKSELKKSGLDEGLLKYVKINDIDDHSKIADVVKDFKEDFLNAKQASIDQKLKDGAIPLHGEADTGKGDSATKEYAEAKNAGKIAGNPFGGKLDEGKSENKGE